MSARRNPARDGISDDDRLAAIPDPGPTVEHVVATSEQVERVRTAIEALPAEQRDALAKQIPLGRLGSVDDIAHAVLYLVSPGGGYVTGCELHVNGGMHMA